MNHSLSVFQHHNSSDEFHHSVREREREIRSSWLLPRLPSPPFQSFSLPFLPNLIYLIKSSQIPVFVPFHPHFVNPSLLPHPLFPIPFSHFFLSYSFHFSLFQMFSGRTSQLSERRLLFLSPTLCSLIPEFEVDCENEDE